MADLLASYWEGQASCVAWRSLAEGGAWPELGLGPGGCCHRTRRRGRGGAPEGVGLASCLGAARLRVPPDAQVPWCWRCWAPRRRGVVSAAGQGQQPPVRLGLQLVVGAFEDGGGAGGQV